MDRLPTGLDRVPWRCSVTRLRSRHRWSPGPWWRRPSVASWNEPSAFLTSGIESARAPGARTGSAMRPGRKSGAGRPTAGGGGAYWRILRTAENVLGVGTAPPRPRPPAVPHQSCHSRATSKGQSRYPADNHGHIYATDELVVLAGPARTHPANMPDKDEAAGASPARPTRPALTCWNAVKHGVRS